MALRIGTHGLIESGVRSGVATKESLTANTTAFEQLGLLQAIRYSTCLSRTYQTLSTSGKKNKGYGAEITVMRGEIVEQLEWDVPDWEYIEGEDEIILLTEDYENNMGKFKKGYYQHYDLEGGYLGDTLEEAKQKLISFKL